MSRKTIRTLASTLALGLVLVACGQHSGVHVEGDPAAGGAQQDDGMGGTEPTVDGDGMAVDDNGEPSVPDANGEVEVDESGQPVEAGNGNGEAGASGEGAEGEQAAEGGEQEQEPQQQEPQGQDRTGVDDDTISIAVHAPVTGAAPLPSQAFEQAGDLYWRWVIEEQGEEVLGRTNIEIEFADDRYEPATARQVCRELMSRNFAVVGGGGTDGIQACGELAGRDRVPYFSPGVTEAGLSGNPWYFPASMTYPQQSELLAEMVASRFSGATAAAVLTQTPNFDGAVEGWERGVQAHGIDYAETLRNPRGQTGWYADFANRLGDQGVEVVYVNMSPLDYIRFAQVADEQGHDFQFVGVGVTMGLNDVLANGCPEVDGGIFFSPFPSLDVVDDIDPEFRQALERFNVQESDLALAIWGLGRAQHELFKRYEERFGTDLTREDFRAVVENAGTVESGIFPPVQYSPDVDFGGQAVHVLEADCSSETHRDAGTNQSSF
jgi:ABC-type branched-subunit amino acid transport system substrate-binding protein